MKQSHYACPNGYNYNVQCFNGIKVETISHDNFFTNTVILHLHGGGCTTPMNDFYRKIAKKYCDLTCFSVVSIDYNIGEDKVTPCLFFAYYE